MSGGTAADQQDAAAFLAGLRDLTGQDIAIVAADPSFEIRFLPRSAGSLWVAGGWSASNGVIVRGSVNVDSDLAPAARRGALRQLFLMAMGFGRPAEAYPESVFALETTASGAELV